MMCDNCKDKFDCYSHCKEMEEWDNLTKSDIEEVNGSVFIAKQNANNSNRDKVIKTIVEKSFESIRDYSDFLDA